MSDKDPSTADDTPQYRVRLPEGATAAPKSAENAAETTTGDTPPDAAATEKPSDAPKEIGGPKGPEPTRFGDWERDGRCVDF